eukprot:scaffold1430_cov257-Pinguiococcus_pyrenoidosus.AAC.4
MNSVQSLRFSRRIASAYIQMIQSPQEMAPKLVSELRVLYPPCLILCILARLVLAPSSSSIKKSVDRPVAFPNRVPSQLHLLCAPDLLQAQRSSTQTAQRGTWAPRADEDLYFKQPPGCVSEWHGEDPADRRPRQLDVRSSAGISEESRRRGRVSGRELPGHGTWA